MPRDFNISNGNERNTVISVTVLYRIQSVNNPLNSIQIFIQIIPIKQLISSPVTGHKCNDFTTVQYGVQSVCDPLKSKGYAYMYKQTKYPLYSPIAVMGILRYAKLILISLNMNIESIVEYHYTCTG